jgi:hypothetical protein
VCSGAEIQYFDTRCLHGKWWCCVRFNVCHSLPVGWGNIALRWHFNGTSVDVFICKPFHSKTQENNLAFSGAYNAMMYLFLIWVISRKCRNAKLPRKNVVSFQYENLGGGVSSWGKDFLSCATRRHRCSYLPVKGDRKLIRSSAAFDWFVPWLYFGRNIPRQFVWKGRDDVTRRLDKQGVAILFYVTE